MDKKKTSRSGKVLALSVGKTMVTLTTLASGMILSRMLSQRDYATYKQTFLAYQFAVPLLSLALPQAVYYFLPEEKENPRRIVIENLVCLTIMGFVFSLFLLLGGTELLAKRFSNPDLLITLKWMIPYPLVMFPMSALGAVLVSTENVTKQAVFNVVLALFTTLGAIVGVFLTRDYAGPIVVKIVVPFLFFPIAFYLMFKGAPGKWRIPRFSMMLKMVKYSVPMGLSTMLGSISLQLDKMIVSSMRSPEEYAIYANGAVEIPLISIITGSISAVILVDMRKHAIKKEYKDAMALFNKASLKSASILFPAMCFFMLMGPEFIEVLFSSRYVESALPFRVYLLHLPGRIVVFGSALMAIGRTDIVLKRSVVTLVLNIIFSILFVNLWGSVGAAIATIIISYSYNLPTILYKLSCLYNVRVKHIFNFPLLGKILLTSILPLFFILPIKIIVVNNILSLSLCCSVYTFFYSSFVLLCNLPIKNELIISIKKMKKTFFRT